MKCVCALSLRPAPPGTPADKILGMVGDLLEGKTPSIQDALTIRTAILQSYNLYQPIDLREQMAATLDVSWFVKQKGLAGCMHEHPALVVFVGCLWACVQALRGLCKHIAAAVVMYVFLPALDLHPNLRRPGVLPTA